MKNLWRSKKYIISIPIHIFCMIFYSMTSYEGKKPDGDSTFPICPVQIWGIDTDFFPNICQKKKTIQLFELLMIRIKVSLRTEHITRQFLENTFSDYYGTSKREDSLNSQHRFFSRWQNFSYRGGGKNAFFGRPRFYWKYYQRWSWRWASDSISN